MITKINKIKRLASSNKKFSFALMSVAAIFVFYLIDNKVFCSSVLKPYRDEIIRLEKIALDKKFLTFSMIDRRLNGSGIIETGLIKNLLGEDCLSENPFKNTADDILILQKDLSYSSETYGDSMLRFLKWHEDEPRSPLEILQNEDFVQITLTHSALAMMGRFKDRPKEYEQLWETTAYNVGTRSFYKILSNLEKQVLISIFTDKKDSYEKIMLLSFYYGYEFHNHDFLKDLKLEELSLSLFGKITPAGNSRFSFFMLSEVYSRILNK